MPPELTAFAENARLLVALDAKVVELNNSLAERDRLASELEHLAFHDALTGLANRALFQRHLNDHSGGRALLLIDLDGFKPINDTFGHAAGDAVLVAVAKRLGAFAGPGDTAARLGGDEFALLTAAPLTAAVETPTPKRSLTGDRASRPSIRRRAFGGDLPRRAVPEPGRSTPILRGSRPRVAEAWPLIPVLALPGPFPASRPRP